MAIQIVVVILFIALLGYIVYLQLEMTKRNIFIESTVRRLSGIEKSRSMDEMMEFLQEIHKLSQYSLFLTDKFPEESTINFILGNETNMKTYIHYTKDESDAKNIIKNGFKFVDSFYKTALPVSNDKLDMITKHNRRKSFGEYIIVICILNDIVNYYSTELQKAGLKNYSFENVLTETPPSRNDNSDIVYQLTSKYIKGYINHRTGEIVKNPDHDARYNSPGFMKNIDLLKNK